MAEGQAQPWFLQLVNDDGTPMVGFDVLHYAAGTTTDKTVWNAADKVTPLAQPVASDANGVVQFWGDGDYKFVIRDPNDAVLYTQDNYRLTQDTFAVWEGSHGTVYPGVTALGKYQLFLKHDASDNFLALGFNDGTNFVDIAATLNASIFNIKSYGAVGDGVTDDTASIQAAVDASGPGDIVYFPGTANFYKVLKAATGYAIDLDGVSDRIFMGGGIVRLSDAGTVADPTFVFRLANTCKNLLFFGMNIQGSESALVDDATVFQYGIACKTGQTVSRIRVINCEFDALNVGVSLDATSGGTAEDSLVGGCHFRFMMGGGGAADLSGQGYGVHLAGKRNKVIDCTFEQTGRHAVLLDTEFEGIVRGCSSYKHRNTRVATAALVRPAFYVVRSSGCLVDGCKVEDFYDCAIAVTKDSVNTASARDNRVTHCRIIGNKNAIPCMQIGEATTDITYFTENVTVDHNTFEMDGADGGLEEAIRFLNGIGVTIEGNDIRVHNLSSGTHNLIQFGHATQMLVGNTVSPVIRNNKFHVSNYAGATIRAFKFENSILITNELEVFIKGNTFYDDGSGTFAREVFIGTFSNGTMIYQDPYRTIPTITIGATQTEFPAYSDVVRVTAGASDLNTIQAAYDGREIKFLFEAGYTGTFKDGVGNMRMAGDLVPNIDDYIAFIYNLTQAIWIESGRSAN